jgi:hypothetical protein
MGSVVDSDPGGPKCPWSPKAVADESFRRTCQRRARQPRIAGRHAKAGLDCPVRVTGPSNKGMKQTKPSVLELRSLSPVFDAYHEQPPDRTSTRCQGLGRPCNAHFGWLASIYYKPHTIR